MEERAVTAIQQIRQDRGLTQDTLAQAVGLNRPLYSAVERGLVLPTARGTVRLMEILRARVRDLFPRRSDIDLARLDTPKRERRLRPNRLFFRLTPTEAASLVWAIQQLGYPTLQQWAYEAAMSTVGKAREEERVHERVR